MGRTLGSSAIITELVEVGPWTYSQKQQHRVSVKYTRTWIATVSRDAATGLVGSPIVIQQYFSAMTGIYFLPIPSYYQLPSGDYDSTAFVSNINVTNSPEDPTHYVITIEYEPLEAMQAGSMDPLKRPWAISCTASMAEKVCEYDQNQNVITNSAGEKFDPPITISDARPLLTITRNEATFDPGYAQEYRLAINSDTFMGAQPGYVQMLNISATREYDDYFGFHWSVTYELFFSNEPMGFTKLVLDTGLRQLVSGHLEGIIVGAGGTMQPTQTPVLLNGSGAYAGDGEPGAFLTFDVYNSLPFNSITPALYPFT